MGCRLPRSENSRRQSSGVVTDQSASPGGLRLRKRQSAKSPVGDTFRSQNRQKEQSSRWLVNGMCRPSATFCADFLEPFAANRSNSSSNA